MRWPELSIRHTILLAIVAAVLLPALLLWQIEQQLTRQEYEPLIAQSRQATLAIVGAEMVSPLWSINEAEIERVALRSLADPALLAIRVTERRPGARPLLRHRAGAAWQDGVRLLAPLSREGELLGTIELWFDNQQVDRLLDERGRATALLAVAQVAIATLVLLLVLGRRLLQPIRQLMQQASDIANRAAAPPVAWQRRDELGALGRHLNEVREQTLSLIDRLEQQRTQLEHTALHDGLTGLPNRTLFRELAQHALDGAARDGLRAAMLFIDLDRFKAINDSMGHSAGDVVLSTVADRLRAGVRGSDLICRHSGDEFIVLLRSVSHVGEITATTDRLLRELEAPQPLRGRDVTVSASIGIAVFPDDGRDSDELIRLADTAMYVSKNLGRARHAYYRSEFESQFKAAVHLEQELRRAIDNDEFVLHYQPQVDSVSGALRGCEALIRWQHPSRGMVSPGEFIPAAEQCGLISDLGAWAIRAACAQIEAWKASGQPFGHVAVNVSALEFRHHRLVDTLTQAMAEFGIAPHEIEIEITESVLMTDTDTTERIVERLQALGLQLAVDDFGTGYSSLAYLKHLRPSKIKIDRSFVRDVTFDEDDRVLVQAIVQLAHALDIAVVAEGVETEEQRQFLRSIGCDTLQGFLISRPQAAAAFAQVAAAMAQTPAPSGPPAVVS